MINDEERYEDDNYIYILDIYEITDVQFSLTLSNYEYIIGYNSLSYMGRTYGVEGYLNVDYVVYEGGKIYDVSMDKGNNVILVGMDGGVSLDYRITLDGSLQKYLNVHVTNIEGTHEVGFSAGLGESGRDLSERYADFSSRNGVVYYEPLGFFMYDESGTNLVYMDSKILENHYYYATFDVITEESND